MAHAADLGLSGTRMSERQAAALLDPALRSPGDSTALAQGLGRLVARLQDDGHLDARATAAWTARNARLEVRVSEGPAYRLRRIGLRVFAPAESAAIAATLGLEAGDPASGSRVAAAMDRALDAAAETGHPYAQLSISGWEPDSAAGVALTLSGTLGPDIEVDGVRFDGAKSTNTRLLERAAGVAPGPYRQSEAEAARARLDQLGLFRSVTLGEPEVQGDFRHARLAFQVEERPYNQFEGVLGSQGDGVLVGLAHVELENLAGTGRAAMVRWEGRGHGVSEASARYREPLVFGLPVAAEIGLETQTYDTLYTRTRGRLGSRWYLSRAERLETSLEADRVVQDGPVREVSGQTTRFALIHERLDDRLSPRRGATYKIEASQSFSRQKQIDGERRSVRTSAAELGLAIHRPLSPHLGLALEARAVGRVGSDAVLALYDRYALGGAASLRGYDEEAYRVDRYALARLELRSFLAGRQYAFLFWDHANAATRLPDVAGTHLQVLALDGYGAGLSLATSAGRVGVTYGVAAGGGFLDGKLHLQVLTPF